MILAHWHGDELPMISVIGPYRVSTMASTSKDGEIMNAVINLVGGRTSRGSSTRKSVSGLLGLIRLVKKKKRNCSLAVDGPKGPIYNVKPGVFELAKLLDAGIFPGGVACDNAWRFPKSWNKAFLPKPFAQVIICWDGPFVFDKTIDPRDPKIAENLAVALHQAREKAAKSLSVRNSDVSL